MASIKFKFRKLCTRWVPKMLTEEHKLIRQTKALDFLTRYSEEGDTFLSRVVTGDETWVSHATPESKQHSMDWRHTSSPTKTKFKQTTSTRKIMCAVFWDRKGVLLVYFLPQGSTINAGFDCDTPKKLRRAIQNKRRGMLSLGVVMIHDKARPHTARRTAKSRHDIWLGTIWSSLLQPRLSAKWFSFVSASQILSCLPAVLRRQQGQRIRYHVLCIARGIILRWRDTKSGATLWQVPQQWWKLCRKVVYGVYIKWQYTWFVTYSCFFLIANRNLLSG